MKSVLSSIYGGIVHLKNISYDQNFLDSYKLPVPVISIGNLSVGGTGKTPITLTLAKELSKYYRRIAIVCRSYKTPLDRPLQVQLGAGPGLKPSGPGLYGDEAYFLAERVAGVVFSGPDKTDTARFAFESLRPDLILVDDGFQHRKLHRDLDFVLWDATETKYQLLPQGKLREGFESLERAHGLFLTKTNWVSEEKRQRLLERFKGKLVCEVRFDLDSKSRFWQEAFGRPVAALSGIANNSSFHQLLEEKLGRPLDQSFAFPDHHTFTERDLQPAREFLVKHPDALLVCTEKDAVKLRAWIKVEPRIWSIPLTLEFDQALDTFLSMAAALKNKTNESIQGPVPAWPF